ncbi:MULTISPECIES: hypothetical protein [Enterobacterales]
MKTTKIAQNLNLESSTQKATNLSGLMRIHASFKPISGSVFEFGVRH